MTDTQKILLHILANELFGRELSLPEQPDWDALYAEAKVQGVPCYLLEAKKRHAPEGLTVEETVAFAQAVSRNSTRLQNHARLHSRLSEAGIPYVIMKGAVSASYYPSGVLRNQGDIDFFVREEDLDRAGELFVADGLRHVEAPYEAHEVYEKPGLQLEMHYTPPGGWPPGEAGNLTREYFSNLIEDAHLHTDSYGSFVAPSTFHHGLILLIHTHEHLMAKGIGLRHFCDWAVFADAIPNDEFVELFEEKLKALGLWRLAQILTRTSIRYLDAHPKAWAGEGDEQLADALLEDVLEAGNFGERDIERRRYQKYFLASPGKPGSDESGNLRSFIKHCNRRIELYWPATERWKVLLPVGWVVLGVRYLFRQVTHKSETFDVATTLEGLSQRQDLYRELRMFTPEDQS